MTDQELLEMAAKASEIKYTVKNGVLVSHGDHVSPPMPWNPLDDDGDAMRLAVRLNMTLIPNDGCNMAFAHCEMISRGERNQVYQAHNGDQCAALRRAIVRAAAEIGRAMK